VNAPIDTPVSGSDSRPMLDWIFDSGEYTALYHQYFQEFLETTDFDALIGTAAELIAPYVEKDPTRFYTYEEFQAGVETLRAFCRLRAQSVSGQLDGSIPSTTEGQAQEPSALVDASSIDLSAMGTMGRNGGPGGNGAFEARPAPFDSKDPPDAEGRGLSGFSGAPGETPAAVSGSALALTALSLCVLTAGILFAFLYRRRKH